MDVRTDFGFGSGPEVYQRNWQPSPLRSTPVASIAIRSSICISALALPIPTAVQSAQQVPDLAAPGGVRPYVVMPLGMGELILSVGGSVPTNPFAIGAAGLRARAAGEGPRLSRPWDAVELAPGRGAIALVQRGLRRRSTAPRHRPGSSRQARRWNDARIFAKPLAWRFPRQRLFSVRSGLLAPELQHALGHSQWLRHVCRQGIGWDAAPGDLEHGDPGHRGPTLPNGCPRSAPIACAATASPARPWNFLSNVDDFHAANTRIRSMPVSLLVSASVRAEVRAISPPDRLSFKSPT